MGSYAYARLESALAELGRAVELGWVEEPRLHGEPYLELLRSDPRFARLAERVAAVPRLP